MYPENFQYFSPVELPEALGLLSQFREKSRVLAGGMSLIPLLKNRFATVPYLIDIGRIKELGQISDQGDSVSIGAMVTDYDLETSDLVRTKLPLVAEVSHWIGDAQVRNRGTMGGSLCHADPSGDWAACVIALRGEMKVVNKDRERSVDSDHFFLDPFTTALESDEMLKSVSFKVPTGSSGYDYQLMERKAGDFSTVGVAVQLTLGQDREISSIGIGMTAVAPTPVRASKAEHYLQGKQPDAVMLKEAAETAAGETDPPDDVLRGSAEFKREMTKVFTMRALKNALGRAGVVIS